MPIGKSHISHSSLLEQASVTEISSPNTDWDTLPGQAKGGLELRLENTGMITLRISGGKNPSVSSHYN